MNLVVLASMMMVRVNGDDPTPGGPDDWYNKLGIQQSGYGWCKGGTYTGKSDPSSGLEQWCAKQCDKANAEAPEGNGLACVGFSARLWYKSNWPLPSKESLYYCYNCPSLTKDDIDCESSNCNKADAKDHQPYRIFARKSTPGFKPYYEFEKDG